MENNVIFNLKQAIGIGASNNFRVKISPDYETGENINTFGQSVSVVLKNASQIERFEAIFADGFMTIVRRGLSKNKTLEEKQELKKQWNEGEIGYITLLAHNIFDANKSNTIKSGEKIYFGGKGAYITSDDNGQNLKFKDELNQEINLSQISAKVGQNNKVAINDSDNPGFLADKLGKGFIIGNKVDVDFSKINFSEYETSEIDDNFDLIIYDKRNNTKKRLSLLKILEKINKNQDDLILKMQKNLVWEYTGENTHGQDVVKTINHNLNIDFEDFLIGRYKVIFENRDEKFLVENFGETQTFVGISYVGQNKIINTVKRNSNYKIRIYKFW